MRLPLEPARCARLRRLAATRGCRPFTQLPAWLPPPSSTSAPLLLRTITTTTTMSPVPFSALLNHLRSLFPSHKDPTSPYAPLLCAVLARLNEPELVVEVIEDLLPRLTKGELENGGGAEDKDVVCVTRVREAMYKVRSCCSPERGET